MATFSGNAAGYRIDLLDNGTIQVVDIDFSDGDTGKHIVAASDLELSFDDGSFQIPVTETAVSASSFGAQDITGLADGSYVVAWAGQTLGGDIYFRRYDGSGNPIGGEVVVNTTTPPNSTPLAATTTALADGGFLVTWGMDTDYGSSIFAQRYDAAGNAIGGEVLVDDQGSYYGPSTIAALSDGGYIIAWSGGGAGDVHGIFAQRYDAAGNEVGKKTRINTSSEGAQDFPSITELSDGGYIVVWESKEKYRNNYDIFAQRYDEDGNVVGVETRINTSGGHQSGAEVIALADGGHVIAWSGHGPGDGSGVFIRHYDAAGNATGNETRVNTAALNNQANPSIATLADGGFVVTWSGYQTGSAEVYAQRFNAAGAKVGSETQVNTLTLGNQNASSVTGLADGGYVVSWKSDMGRDFYTRRFDADGEPVDMRGEKLVVTGTADADVMNGGLGQQILMGGDGNDTLNGGSNNDELHGEGGSDTLSGGSGNDLLYGGDGGGTLSGGTGNDRLYGGAGSDTLTGAAGDDFLDGAGGVDTVSGGAGKDTISVNGGVANGGDGADTMRGNYGGVLNGGQGNDDLFLGRIMNGGAGDDTLSAGNSGGVVNYDGGTGNDTLNLGFYDDDRVGFFTAIDGGDNVDKIKSFEGRDDRLLLGVNIFTALEDSAGGKLNAANFRASIGGNAADADDHILFDTATGALYYDADGSGAGAKVQFAVVIGNPGLSASVFEVI